LSRQKLQLWLANRIWFAMLQRTLPAGFIARCLPTKTDKLPSGGQWLHEIKLAAGFTAGGLFYRGAWSECAVSSM
jgi:hypothetical protein